ncbi:MAG: hypothetical protein GY854_19920 [Deltaproteobacteria bacterium]|nr:hypothetical protein [Deltaproteobacteria bacterium]
MGRINDDTQIRLIKAEARSAVEERSESILSAVRAVGEDIKREMHTHFATLADLADWKLDLYQELDTKTRGLISEHVKRDHRVSIIPGASTAKGRITGKQIAALVSAIGAIYALAQAL